jgi:hypothetical protein
MSRAYNEILLILRMCVRRRLVRKTEILLHLSMTAFVRGAMNVASNARFQIDGKKIDYSSSSANVTSKKVLR